MNRYNTTECIQISNTGEIRKKKSYKLLNNLDISPRSCNI